MLQNRPEHAEDISNVYLLNQIFESVSDLFGKRNIKQDRTPPYGIICVSIS